MNNTFSLQRFIWLFNKLSKEHLKIYLLVTLLMACFIAIVMGYLAYFEDLSVNVQKAVFTCLLLSMGVNFSIFSFADLWQKNKAISLLTLPVSTFERFLVKWIYSFVIFQLVFIVCFYAIDMAILGMLNRNAELATPLLDVSPGNNSFYIVFLCFAFFHALHFLGSVTYHKLHVIKASLLFLALILILVFFNLGFVRLLIGGNATAELPFSIVSIQEGSANYNLEDKSLMRILILFLLSISSLCLWTAAYFKLKEKQV
jgi:hypothetical protein